MQVTAPNGRVEDIMENNLVSNNHAHNVQYWEYVYNITNKSGDSRLRKQLNLFDFTPVSDNRECMDLVARARIMA